MIATTLAKNNLQASLRQESPGKLSSSVSSPRTDEELARRAAAGDLDAFEELVRRRRKGLVRFLASFSESASDAEDLAQETFLRAYRNLYRYDPRKPFLTWLYVIARRLAINFKRNRLRRGESPLPEGETEIPGNEGAPFSDSDSLWVSASKLLSPDAFMALRLHYGESMPVKEIAEVLGKSTTGTKVLLFRARRSLADKMNPQTYEPINP
ncbi:MAG: RNA polymerase sigma factor [Opitutales bacterium]|nr:RNA polymerase sigma factor [Opitutales bacterium]